MGLTSSISVHRGVTPPHGNQCFYHSWARELPLKFFPWPLKKFDPLEKSSWPPPKSWTYYVGRPCVCTDAAKSGGIFFRGVYSKLFIPGVFILVTTKNMLWLYEFNLGQHQAPVKWPSHYTYLFYKGFYKAYSSALRFAEFSDIHCPYFFPRHSTITLPLHACLYLAFYKWNIKIWNISQMLWSDALWMAACL